MMILHRLIKARRLARAIYSLLLLYIAIAHRPLS